MGKSCYMASLKKVSRSPFWYIRRRDLDTGRWRDEATKLRRNSPQDTRGAQRLADKYSAQENQLGSNGRGEEFVAWVPDYIAGHYKNEHTRKRAEFAWNNIREWLRDRKLRHPREIRYAHGQDFVDWRKASGSAKHNTVRLELKFFSFVLNEAIRREFCDRNALAQVKMPRDPVAEKGDVTDATAVKIREALTDRADRYRIVFEIMLHMGCRFGEASIPLERIHFDALEVIMEDSKRKPTDPRKLYRVPLPAQLAAFLRPLQNAERTVPPLTREQNRRFNKILKSVAGITSHSLRVAFVTRCHAAGLTIQEAMRLTNHSSKAVHMIYSRLDIISARQARDRVPLPPAPAPLAR